MSRCCAAILNIQRCTRTVSKHAVTTRGTTWLKRSEFATNSPHPQRLSTIAQPTLDKEGLHITDACVSQIKKVASPEEFLRVLVEGGGVFRIHLQIRIRHGNSGG
ncbi:unnamed protein product [Clavelina lepadiformis]|uniref:Uncharacterized protein n=1 Tax=Clavelina lepadiformis TaxID=159417 RepID=A0ABP0FAA4_CLALP